MQALNDAIKQIRKYPDISTLNEDDAKRTIILRILSSLGWDIYSYDEIKSEYGIETRRVDYALQVNGGNEVEVFIEAKKPQEDLENHQEQLLDYSFREGVKLAILTNGIAWWFYLPTKPGAWNDRKFYTIDILEQEIEDIADKFVLLLSRQNVGTGKAIQHAESILARRERKKIIGEKLPEAWNSVVKEPDSILMDLLSETAEKMCGFKPKGDEILRFMRSHQEKWLLSPESEPAVPPPAKRPETKTERQTGSKDQKPQRMQIGNENYELKYVYEILVNTANWLIDQGALKPSDCPVRVSRGKRSLIDRTPVHILSGKDFWSPRDLKKGLYIEVHSNSEQTITLAQSLLKKYEYDPKRLQIK